MFRFTHNKLKKGNGTIEVKAGSTSITTITKGKSGNLLVVSFTKIKFKKKSILIQIYFIHSFRLQQQIKIIFIANIYEKLPVNNAIFVVFSLFHDCHKSIVYFFV